MSSLAKVMAFFFLFKNKEYSMNMHKVILVLAIAFLSDSALFASKNVRIYPVKDGETHISTTSNQDQCATLTFQGTTLDGKGVYAKSECQSSHKK